MCPRHPSSGARRAIGLTGLALTITPCVLAAQTLEEAAQHAALARAAFQEAGKAPTLREALPHVIRAARVWPTQPSYWLSMARIGARLADTAAVHEALDALAPMGAGQALMGDTVVQRVAQSPTLRAAMTDMTRKSAAVKGGRIVATLTDSTIFAEGVDADPGSGHLYVASIRHRTVIEVAPDGRVRDLKVGRASQVGAILGVRVDHDGEHLYVTTAGLPFMQGYGAADSVIHAILRVRVADGSVVKRWDLPRDGARHLLGDLTVAADGTVYATDSYAPIVWVLRPQSDTLATIRHARFRSLQGIVSVPGDARLLVADYSHGLLRIDLATGAVVRVHDAAGSTTLGIDGISWHDGSIIAVQNGVQAPRVAQFVLNADQTAVESVRIIDRQPDLADEPTIGTIWQGGFVYVANSQWEKYEESGARRAGTTLAPTRLMCVPLDQPATGRKGTRSTTSVPPASRGCSTSAAASP